MNKFLLVTLICLIALVQIAAADYFELTDLDITVDGDSVSEITADSGTYFDEVEPGDDVKIEIEVENTYPETEDYEGYEIEDVEIEVEVEGFCEEDDLEFTDDASDLDPGDDYEYKLEFDVPKCTDEDTYRIRIKITAEDEKTGEEYYMSKSINMEVEKLGTELELSTPEVSPDTVSCDRDIEVDIEVHNIGSRDEDDAGLLIINDDLDINEFEFFDVEAGDYDDDDTYYIETFSFTVPDDVSAGDYKIRAEIEYYHYDEVKKDYVYLTVEDCGTAVADDEADEEETDDEETTIETDEEETDLETTTDADDQETITDQIELDTSPETEETTETEEKTQPISSLMLGVIAIIIILSLGLILWFSLLLTEK